MDKKFRIIRAAIGKKAGFGNTIEAATAREAVRKEAKQHREAVLDTMGGLIAPGNPSATEVIGVYELVKVDPKEWK